MAERIPIIGNQLPVHTIVFGQSCTRIHIETATQWYPVAGGEGAERESDRRKVFKNIFY